MLSIRSFAGLSISLLLHGAVGGYLLAQNSKKEPPKPKEIPLQMAMFKIAPPPPVIAKPVESPPPPKPIEKVVEPKPIEPTPPPPEKIPEPVVVKKVVEPTPAVKPIVRKPDPKPPAVKPKPKIKKKIKKKVKKKKPKKKIIKKKQVVKKKPVAKPRKVTPPKRKAVVHKRPIQKSHPAPVRKVAPVKRATRPPAKKPPRKVPPVQKPRAQKKPVRKPTPATPKTLGNPQLERQYQNSIRQKIEQKKTYPRRAKRRNVQGIVQVGFSINRSGVISKLRIVKSSGSKTLDKAALQAVRGVGRFPAIPAGIRKPFLDYIIPIAYRLR